MSVAVHCQYCDKSKSPHRVLMLPGNVRICDNCLEWHGQAMRALAGEPPRGCQKCGITFDQLCAAEGGADIKMRLVAKDGIYQVLCGACVSEYRRKNRNFYCGTEAYWRHSLDGSR